MLQWVWMGLGGVSLLALADLGVHLFYAWSAIQRLEVPPNFKVPPPVAGLEAEELRIATTDQLELSAGIYYPADGHPHGIVVFCPETDGRYDTAMNYAEALVDSGIAVLAFTFRNQGDSDSLATYRATHWVTQYEVADVHAVLDFIAAQPQFEGLPTGLFGVSRGAGAALAAGATRPEVRAVWTQGAYSTKRLVFHFAVKWVASVVGPQAKWIPDWHIRTTTWFMLRLAEIRNGGKFVRLESLIGQWSDRSMMFLAGARDTYVPGVISRQLCQLAGHSPDRSFWLVPKAKHNLERTAARLEFDQRLVQFFDQAFDARSILVREDRRVAR